MELVRFAAANNTGAAQLVAYTVPQSAPLRLLFEGQGAVRFRLTSAYINVTNGATTRAIPLFNLALTFAYLNDAVNYYDADSTGAGTLNQILSGSQWNLYFNSDQSDWIPMPNGQIGAISATWIPPIDYTFTAGDNVFFFATLLIDSVPEDTNSKFKRYFG